MELYGIYPIHNSAMKSFLSDKKRGYSLVETIIGIFVMGLVITGGLVAMGQATLLSEKGEQQSIADFFLRAEVEQLRAMDWTDIEALGTTIKTYETKNAGGRYPNLQTLDSTALSSLNMSAEVKSETLNKSGETGKKIFHITLNWEDKTGKTHTESRVLVITEGGFSAKA